MHFSVISWQKSTVTVGLHTSPGDPSTSGQSSCPRPGMSAPHCLSSRTLWLRPTSERHAASLCCDTGDLGWDEPLSEEGDDGLDVRSMLAETGGGWLPCTSLHTCWERKERFCHSSVIQTFSWLRSLSNFSFSHTWIHNTQYHQVSIGEILHTLLSEHFHQLFKSQIQSNTQSSVGHCVYEATVLMQWKLS